MGINGLWHIVGDYGRCITLQHLSSVYRIEGTRKLCLGVDISTIMLECINAVEPFSSVDQCTDVPLHIFFSKLAILSKTPIDFVFVYDGPGRPCTKRGASVSMVAPSWTASTQELVGLFGYHIHQAPGEAEAELSALNVRGLVDGVMTSDSDAFVFGAPVIYRTKLRADRNFEDECIMFHADDLRREAGLTRGGYLLFALLSGGDYSPGVAGCGPVVAYGISRGVFGDQLLHAIQTIASSSDLDVFFEGWRIALRDELNTNRQRLLFRRAPVVASGITESFPIRAVLDLYANPLTSWSYPAGPAGDGIAGWGSRELSIPGLMLFRERYIGCTIDNSLNSWVSSGIVWEGICLQIIYSASVISSSCLISMQGVPFLTNNFQSSVIYDADSNILRSPVGCVTVVDARLKRRRGRFALPVAGGSEPQVRLTVRAPSFVSLTSTGITLYGDHVVRLWVHARLLPAGIFSGS